jgi:trimeric autotransporter adhesin
VVITDPQNTAVGDQALFSNMGASNTATGFHALFANTTGADNTANGNGALTSNTTGFSNTANGSVALVGNITGHQNTANGTSALFNNTTGNFNTATGEQALVSNTTGNGNTAAGQNALASNTTGSFCTALGEDAGFNVSTANNVICIGFGVGGANVSNSCYIGSIFGQTSSGGVAVFIDSAGKLGTLTSSRRFKEGIKPMEQASEVLFALKPVTFRYKKEIGAASTSQFGLVAEDVEKVNPDLVVRDKEGNPYSVRYDQVNAMLLNEFLKEHRKNEEQEAEIARQQKQIEAITAGLQKVSAQLEANKSTPQVVTNNR